VQQAPGPIPTPGGLILETPGQGESVTIQLPAPASQPGQPADWHPTASVTIAGMTQAEAVQVQQANQALAANPAQSSVKPPSAQSVPSLSAVQASLETATGSAIALAASGCSTAEWYYGMDQLWAKMSQTWCYADGFINYWPAASCWGYDSWPTYAYLGCSTSQLYGLWWNQGRTTWDADLCPAWVPLWGSCVSHDRVHSTYYFTPDGGAWQI